MLVIAVAMLVILVLAGLVIFYVAFPHRGQTPPQGEWLGGMMSRAADAVPTLEHDARARVGAQQDRSA